jgi:phosphoglycolate phosphatase-like HAD superfamily hydrolase
MAVEGAIFDVSETLVDRDGRAVPSASEAFARLSRIGVRIIAVSTHPIARQLRSAGLSPDLVVTRQEVNANKGSRAWVDYIKRQTGLESNELIYAGDTDLDMRTAANSQLVYFHAGWVGPREKYGMLATSPQWIAAVVEHIFRKKHPWWWSIDSTDPSGKRVRYGTN